MTTIELELKDLDHWLLVDALYDYCYDEKHPDDFFNTGVHDNYASLTREQQLEVLATVIKETV